jgi:thiol-disulfide isomerase/thioredoxin
LKLAIRCPCPRGGKCICGEDCVCPNCPEHSKAKQTATTGQWKGTTPTNKGIELLFFGASWCTACPAAEARLGSAKSEIYYIDCTDSNPIAQRYGVNGFPYLLKIQDGRFIEGRAGDAVHETAARDWLSGRTLPAGVGANTVGGKPSAPAATSRTYSAPRMTVARGNGPGHTHRCSYCGTSWSHENWNVGSPSAHTCPNCQRITYGNRTEGWNAPARTRNLPVTYFMSSPRTGSRWVSGACPNCPR